MVSYRVELPSPYPWADTAWAIRETLSHLWLGNLRRSTEDYWNIWKDRPAYIDKYYSEDEILERAGNG